MADAGSGPSTPTIAILPFDSPPADPGQEYFARGFVEDLATELSRVPTLEVVHPQTSFALSRASPSGVDLPEVLRDGYLLCGTVRRILAYRRQFDEAERHVQRATELNPNDANVLAHAALCRTYLGDPQSASRLASKAMRLHPAHPDWDLACAAFPLFFLERYEESAALVAKGPRAFVDLPALLAAAHALLGEPARAELGEPLRWLLHVNPLRRAEDVDRLTRGLRLAGLPADPDEGWSRAVARPASDRGPGALFRRAGGFWTLAFDGLMVQLTEVKGFHDLAALLAEPHVGIHCLELAGRSTEPRGDAPVLDERARRELAARARELQEEVDEAEALNDRARAERARESLDHLVTGPPGGSAWPGGLAGSAAPRSGPAPRSRGGSGTRSARSARRISPWAATSSTRSGPAPLRLHSGEAGDWAL